MNPNSTPLLAALIAGCVALSGCESVVVRKAEDIAQRMWVKVRAKGERRMAEPAEVASELRCGSAGAPPARIEASETLPLRVKAGSELNHRLVLATCPGNADALTGTLTRRFVHQGRTLFQDSEPYTLKPGRWSVNVFVGIPPQTVSGAYRLELRFEKPGLALERSTDFTVL